MVAGLERVRRAISGSTASVSPKWSRKIADCDGVPELRALSAYERRGEQAWGLKIRGMGKQQIAERVKERRAFWSWTACLSAARVSYLRSASACGDGACDCA